MKETFPEQKTEQATEMNGLLIALLLGGLSFWLCLLGHFWFDRLCRFRFFSAFINCGGLVTFQFSIFATVVLAVVI
jgi:hypothetical protein